MRWVKIVVWIFLPTLLASSLYVRRVHVLGLLSIYGLASLGRISFQMLAARRVMRGRTGRSRLPMASIIVPVYNEDPVIFTRAIAAYRDQDYPEFEVIVVDDGSDNAPKLKRICHALGVPYVYQMNGGKREAMFKGFSLMNPKSKVVLTGDSDTVWSKNAARELVKVLNTRGTGAVTGYVAVSNAKDNLLTRMIDQRYYMAFNQERAAQGHFGVVTCVSGPLGAYRRDLIEQIKLPFILQRFMGKPCTFGDDRHLTNLVLGLGYKVKYAPKAVAYTEAPTSIARYITQQARWGKSHWREMIWQFKALPVQHLYLSYDWIISLLLPFLLVLSLGYYGVQALTGHPEYILRLLAMMVGMSVVRVIEPVIRTRRLDFLLFSAYTVLHLFVLLPLKFWSLLTINATGWGLRPTVQLKEVKA